MPVFIALYRGINVLGRNCVKMNELCALHQSIGHESVVHYIQSGNIIFTAEGSADVIGEAIAKAFAWNYPFVPAVMVRTLAQWKKFHTNNPYSKFAIAEPRHVHAAICEGSPDAKQLAALLKRTGGREQFTVSKGIVYLHAPDGYGTSKFAAGMERAAGCKMTVRNWRTMEQLLALANRCGKSQ